MGTKLDNWTDITTGEVGRRDRCPLSRAQKIDLVEHVADSLELTECEHGFHSTEAFLAMYALPGSDVKAWLRGQEIECDCDVMAKLEYVLPPRGPAHRCRPLRTGSTLPMA